MSKLLLPGRCGCHGRAHATSGGRGLQGEPGPVAHSNGERAGPGQVAREWGVWGCFQGNVDPIVHSSWLN